MRTKTFDILRKKKIVLNESYNKVLKEFPGWKLNVSKAFKKSKDKEILEKL